MFVTNLPPRIVGAKYEEIVSSGVSKIGCEGLGTRIKVHGEGLVLSPCDCADKSAGYALSDGEVLEFSGCADLCNTGTETSVYLFQKIRYERRSCFYEQHPYFGRNACRRFQGAR